MKPKERNLLTEIDMTKYQKVAQLKRAVKNEVSKVKPVIKQQTSTRLPDYITKNPWY